MNFGIFIDTTNAIFTASFIFFIVSPLLDSLVQDALNLISKFPHSKAGWNIQQCLSSPLEGCLTSIDCSVADLHFCAWLIRWKNGERKYIQSYPLWQSCEQSHSFSFVPLFSLLCSLVFKRMPIYPHLQLTKSAWLFLSIHKFLYAGSLTWSCDCYYYPILTLVFGHDSCVHISGQKGSHFPRRQQFNTWSVCDMLNTAVFMSFVGSQSNTGNGVSLSY